MVETSRSAASGRGRRSEVCVVAGHLVAPGVPARRSGVAGLQGLGDLEDDGVPVGRVPGDSAVRDGPREALPYAAQVVSVTMRYRFST